MARLTAEIAVTAVGSRYDLVLIASRRVRELRNGHRAQIEPASSEIVTALQEIEQGLVGRDYLLRPAEINTKSRRSANAF